MRNQLLLAVLMAVTALTAGPLAAEETEQGANFGSPNAVENQVADDSRLTVQATDLNSLVIKPL